MPARLTTESRLWLAAVLCVLPLGLAWSATTGFFTLGFTIYGDCSYSTGTYCTTDTYIPGTYLPGHEVVGSDTTARVFLVFAALVLGYVASRTRTRLTHRAVRAATVAIGIAAALALASRAVLALLCLGAALALVGPRVWRRPGKDGVFVPSRMRG